jgi:hypothetical protein
MYARLTAACVTGKEPVQPKCIVESDRISGNK